MRVSSLVSVGLLSVSVLAFSASAFAEQRVCWGTKTQSIQPLTVTLTCTQKASATNDDVNAYLNTLSDDDKEDVQDECTGSPESFTMPSSILVYGSPYSIYGSWGFDSDEPLKSSALESVYDTSITITLGSCSKTMSASEWSDFVSSNNNQVLVCDGGSLHAVSSLSCSSFGY